MPCKCRDGLRRWHGQLHKLKESHIGGLEKFFCFVLYFLRLGSISEWLSFCITGGRTSGADHAGDRLIVDWYVVLKTFVVGLLLFVAVGHPLSWLVQIIVWYLLGEMYVSLLNVVFVGTLKEDRKISVGRSLLLLMFNAAQLVLSFAVFYRVYLHQDVRDALFTSVQVFSTLDAPENARILVTLQVALNFLFLAVLLARFLGMPEERRKQIKPAKEPKQS